MTIISPQTRILLVLSALKGVGPSALKKVAAIPRFWELSFVDWCKAVPQIAKSTDGQSPDLALQTAGEWAGEQLAAAERHDARIISRLDDDYPKLLAATKDDPLILYVKGRFAEDPQKSVAIIGTREPTQHGQRIAERITQFFVEQRWSVVSGLAIGCDAIAHQKVIEAGGHTVAVLAHGLQLIAPSRHKKLAQSILESGGALVSEYPFGRNVLGAQFVKRDRTQAGMSQGVVMIQSDLRGGSLHASRAAVDYKRWLAVPYPTDKDLKNAEPKVSANLVIADGTDAQRADLLRCSMSALGMVKVVRGRDDYLRLIEPEHSTTSSPLDNGIILPNDEALTGSEASGYAPESQSKNTLLDFSSFQERDLTVNAKAEPSSELVQHVSKSFPHWEGRELTGAASGPVRAVTTYYLEVTMDDFKNLKIAPKTAREESHRDIHFRNDDINSALSRLDHLQMRLDELRKVLAPKRLTDRQRMSKSRFQIEDVLTHMKRSVDEFMYLDHGMHSRDLRSIAVKHRAASGQSELPLLNAEAEGLHDTPLVEVLEHLIDTMPRTLNITNSDNTSEPNLRELRTKVHLGDMVLSFNELIEVFLQTRSSDSTPQ